MPTFEFGETVVVPFPFVDAPIAKKRPAAIVSNAEFNSLNGHVVLAMITTASNSFWPSDHRIVDLEDAGLTHSSVIRMKLFTLPEKVILRALGILSRHDCQALEATLRLLGPTTNT